MNFKEWGQRVESNYRKYYQATKQIRLYVNSGIFRWKGLIEGIIFLKYIPNKNNPIKMHMHTESWYAYWSQVLEDSLARHEVKWADESGKHHVTYGNNSFRHYFEENRELFKEGKRDT